MAYPYHPAEHLETVRTAADVINQELSTYTECEEFQGLIEVLSKIYGQTSILKSCTKYAMVMSFAQTNPNSGDTRLEVDGNFLAGEILGIHSVYRSVNSYARSRYAQYDPLWPYTLGDPSFDPENKQLRQIVGEFADYRKSGWIDLYELQTEPFQQSITNAVMKAYEGAPNANELGDTFTAGVLFSANLAIHALGETGWRLNQAPNL